MTRSKVFDLLNVAMAVVLLTTFTACWLGDLPLTLTQPWATLVALQAKRIETRSWRTPYRGVLAIHAAKGFPKWARETAQEPDFARETGSVVLPVGMVIATCRLISCIPTRELQQNRVIEVDHDARCRCGYEDGRLDSFRLDDRERTFGDYSPGRWAWLLANVEPIEPVPAKGALGLWEWDGAR